MKSLIAIHKRFKNSDTQEIQELREQRYWKAHIEAEDSCVFSDTILNIELKIEDQMQNDEIERD